MGQENNLVSYNGHEILTSSQAVTVSAATVIGNIKLQFNHVWLLMYELNGCHDSLVD